MSRFDQAKMLMRVRKIQKELQKMVITTEQGDGAVKVEITGEQKLKKVHINEAAERIVQRLLIIPIVETQR